MARNRVIYQSEALYVSKNINSTVSGEHRELNRVQNANYNFSIERKDVNQFGQLARIDALVVKSPTVALDFSYYPTDGYNERALGFYVNTGQGSGNFASGQMGSSSGQNYFIVTAAESVDLNLETSLVGKTVIGIGNAYLSNYTLDAKVGDLLMAKVTVEGLNMNSSVYGTGYVTGTNLTGTGAYSPVIDPAAGVAVTGFGGTGNPVVTLPLPVSYTGTGNFGQNTPSALRFGDVVLNFADFGNASSTTGSAIPISNLSGTIGGNLDASAIRVQSASLALPLSRTPIEQLGSRFAVSRPVQFPITATLNVSAVLNEIQARNLATMIDDSTERNVTLSIKNPKNASTNAMIVTLAGARLRSESFTASIGANKTVDIVFETQIGGPTDIAHGVLFSGMGTGDASVAGWGY
jgi:hypothetical protein